MSLEQTSENPDKALQNALNTIKKLERDYEDNLKKRYEEFVNRDIKRTRRATILGLAGILMGVGSLAFSAYEGYIRVESASISVNTLVKRMDSQDKRVDLLEVNTCGIIDNAFVRPSNDGKGFESIDQCRNVLIKIQGTFPFPNPTPISKPTQTP